MYAKYIDENTIRIAPKKYVTPTLVAFNFNENEPLMLQEGYLPLVEDEVTEVNEGMILRPQYELCSETIEEENEDGQFVDVNREYIAVHWVEEEAQDED